MGQKIINYTAAQINDRLAKAGNLITNTTYDELKGLRESSQLVAGMQYRITDYTCTTTQENTQSAGHVFDIIVTADSARTLNENARAIQHENDTYFTGCYLAAWELKYCVDNDTERFLWADEENGKGVVFYMKDEWNNACPYDFKNIMFQRYFDEDAEFYKEGDSEDNEWCYTFCMIDKFDGKSHDLSVEQFKYPSEDNNFYNQYDNVIAPYYDNFIEKEDDDKLSTSQVLNNIVFVTDTNICFVEDDYSYGGFYGFYSNTFGNNCYSNTFGNYFSSNTFGNYCYSNTFGNYCSANTFGNDCCLVKLLRSYMRYIKVDNGVCNTNITTTSAATSNNSYAQNIRIKSGIHDKTCSISTTNNAFLTTFGSASDTNINV